MENLGVFVTVSDLIVLLLIDMEFWPDLLSCELPMDSSRDWMKLVQDTEKRVSALEIR